MSGNPLLNPQTSKWKGMASADALHLFRGIYIELRIMNQILAGGLNVEPLLDQLRADPTSAIPDSQNGEYTDGGTYTADPSD